MVAARNLAPVKTPAWKKWSSVVVDLRVGPPLKSTDSTEQQAAVV